MAVQGKEEVTCAQKGAALSRQEGTVCAQLGEVTACDILGDWPVVPCGREFRIQDIT